MILIVITKTGDFALIMGTQSWILEITLNQMEKDVPKLNQVILDLCIRLLCVGPDYVI